MLTKEEQQRIHDLRVGHSEPVSGFERHFLKALHGEARWASSKEKEWLDFAHASPITEFAENDHGGQEGKTSILDLAVVAASVGEGIHNASEVAANPLLARAIEMTTNRPLEDLASDPESLQAAINTAKGKYFELLVQEKLNAGESIGDLVLTSDQHAALAEKMNQPGWDLAILDQHNEVADVVQIKATDSVSYIKETLERYPDIKIISTSEAANIHPDDGLVIDSGISDSDIEEVVGEAFSSSDPGFGQDFIDSFNPLFPMIFIAATEGYKVSVGRASVDQALESSLSRSKNSLTGVAVGAVFHAMGFGWLSIIPAVLSAKAGPEGIIDWIENGVKSVERWYQNQLDEDKRTRQSRNESMAARQTELLRQQGIERTVSPEEANNSRLVDTGIPVVDDFFEGFSNGWSLGKDPEVQEQIRADNERERERVLKVALEIVRKW